MLLDGDNLGKECPNCGERYYTPPIPDTHDRDYEFQISYQEIPHPDQSHCIQYLKYQIQELTKIIYYKNDALFK